MLWASIDEFRKSAAYTTVTEFHGWTNEKLTKFLSAFQEIFTRAKRNGADDAKAEKLAFPIAFDIGKRAASADTIAKAESAVHYVAAMAKNQASRNLVGDTARIGGTECKFSLLETSLPLLKALVAGVAPNWQHNPEHQIGVIRDIVPRAAAPAEIQAKADPSTPFFFVASYRSDVPPEARNEIGVSAEWWPLGGGEVLPFNFAKSHTPLNGPELGIAQVAALLSDQEPEKKTIVATTPKGYQSQSDSTHTGVPHMPNDDTAEGSATGSAPDGDLKAQVAALSTDLEKERNARKNAELQVAAFKTQAEATEKLAKDASAQVAALQKTADEKAADEAALGMVKDGKCAADKALFFKELYLSMGKEKFGAMVAALPTTTIGEGDGQAKGAGAPPVSLSDEKRKKLAAGAMALMKAGG